MHNINETYFNFAEVKTDLKFAGIYQIFCIVNNKRYIGSSINITKRWYAHSTLLKNNNHCSSYLQNTFNKYGIGNFKFSVLEKVSKIEELINREQFWLDYFESYKPEKGFNVRKIAESNFGVYQSEETRKKRSLSCASKLNEEDIINIRKLYHFCSKREIAEIYNISKGMVADIAKHRAWKHIPFNEKYFDYENADFPSSSKLENIDIQNIRELFKFCKDSEIAKIYNVCSSTIERIKSGKNWKDKNFKKVPKTFLEITEEDVKNIRKLVFYLTIPEILDLYRIHKSDVPKIKDIIYNKTWQDLKTYEIENIPKKSVGSMNIKAKLIEKDVINIKYLYKFLRQCEIAKIYGVSKNIISNIIRDKTWKHVKLED